MNYEFQGALKRMKHIQSIQLNSMYKVLAESLCFCLFFPCLPHWCPEAVGQCPCYTSDRVRTVAIRTHRQIAHHSPWWQSLTKDQRNTVTKDQREAVMQSKAGI